MRASATAAAVAGLAAGGPTAVAGLNGAPLMGLGMGAGAARRSGTLDIVSPITFWAQGYGAWADFDGNGNAAGANRTLGGFMSGMDAMFNDNWRVGGALGYAQSDVERRRGPSLVGRRRQLPARRLHERRGRLLRRARRRRVVVEQTSTPTGR